MNRAGFEFPSIAIPLMNPPIPPPIQPHYVVAQRPESGTVTALGVSGLIVGTIGLLGSFIPCLGALAIWLAIPASLCGGGAVYLAKTKGCSIGLPVAALVVSVLGLIISSVQIMALAGAGKAAKSGLEAMDEQMREERRRQQEHQQQQPQTSLPNER